MNNNVNVSLLRYSQVTWSQHGTGSLAKCVELSEKLGTSIGANVASFWDIA
jgi:hypothetical protein